MDFTHFTDNKGFSTQSRKVANLNQAFHIKANQG